MPEAGYTLFIILKQVKFTTFWYESSTEIGKSAFYSDKEALRSRISQQENTGGQRGGAYENPNTRVIFESRYLLTGQSKELYDQRALY
jgi:hypothetical protein